MQSIIFIPAKTLGRPASFFLLRKRERDEHVKMLCTPALTQFDFTIAFVFQMSLKVSQRHEATAYGVQCKSFLSSGSFHNTQRHTHTERRALCRTVSIQLSKVLYSLSTLSSQKRVIKLHYLTFYCARAPKQKQRGSTLASKKFATGRPLRVKPPQSRCDLNGHCRVGRRRISGGFFWRPNRSKDQLFDIPNPYAFLNIFDSFFNRCYTGLQVQKIKAVTISCSIQNNCPSSIYET